MQYACILYINKTEKSSPEIKKFQQEKNPAEKSMSEKFSELFLPFVKVECDKSCYAYVVKDKHDITHAEECGNCPFAELFRFFKGNSEHVYYNKICRNGCNIEKQCFQKPTDRVVFYSAFNKRLENGVTAEKSTVDHSRLFVGEHKEGKYADGNVCADSPRLVDFNYHKYEKYACHGGKGILKIGNNCRK